MDDLSDKKLGELKQDKLEKLIEEKVNEKTREKEQKIERLEKQVEKLKTNSNTIDRSSQAEASQSISRRDFLKKAGLGSLGLAALVSPVSADYFIKDDSFSVQTSNDGGNTLNEGLFVDQNQNVNIPNGILSVQGGQVATRNWANSNLVSSVNGENGDVSVSSPSMTQTTKISGGYLQSYGNAGTASGDNFGRSASVPDDPSIWHDGCTIEGFNSNGADPGDVALKSLQVLDVDGNELYYNGSPSLNTVYTVNFDDARIGSFKANFKNKTGGFTGGGVRGTPHQVVVNTHRHQI